jgi:hypothetical protein
MAVKYAPGSMSFAVARQATAEATQRALVRTAKRLHGEVMRTDPRPARFTRTVDGRSGAAEESVKPDGVITYTYPRLDAVVQYAMEVLFDMSPVLSGLYRRSHTLFVAGVAVPDLKTWDGESEIVISNTVPYARKIELGIMKMRVPGSSRVYDMAEREVRARFGNVAQIFYTYRGIIGGGVASGRAGNKSDLRYPALVIRER